MVTMPNRCGSVSPVPHPHQEQGDLWHHIIQCTCAYLLKFMEAQTLEIFLSWSLSYNSFCTHHWNRSW